MKKQSNNIVETDNQTTTAISPPPSPGAPSVPQDTVRPTAKSRLAIPRAQIAIGKQVQAELEKATAADLGPFTPDLPQLASAIGLASAWSGERIKAADWTAFAREQEVTSWDPAMAGLAKLKPALEVALARDPSIAERLPALTKFFGLRKQSAAKGSRTRSSKNAPPAPPKPGPTT
jgi:hypothetical protein